MAHRVRPRRSVLYMPGDNARAMEKAKSLPADVVVFDLEDAVAPDAKPRARAQATSAVSAGGYGRREVVIRVNALSTSWGRDDVAAVARVAPHAVLLPKVDDVETVRAGLDLLIASGARDDVAV